MLLATVASHLWTTTGVEPADRDVINATTLEARRAQWNPAAEALDNLGEMPDPVPPDELLLRSYVHDILHPHHD